MSGPTREQVVEWAAQSGFGKLLKGDGLPTMWWGQPLELLDRFAALAYAAGQASKAPEGWKLVPVGPTEEMYGAAYDLANKSAIENYGAPPPLDDLWFTLLAAAPSPEGGES